MNNNNNNNSNNSSFDDMSGLSMDLSGSFRTILGNESVYSYICKGHRSLGASQWNLDMAENAKSPEDAGAAAIPIVRGLLVEEQPENTKPGKRESFSACGKEPSLDIMAVFASRRILGLSSEQTYMSVKRIGITDAAIFASARRLGVAEQEEQLPQAVLEHTLDHISNLMNEPLMGDSNEMDVSSLSNMELSGISLESILVTAQVLGKVEKNFLELGQRVMQKTSTDTTAIAEAVAKPVDVEIMDNSNDTTTDINLPPADINPPPAAAAPTPAAPQPASPVGDEVIAQPNDVLLGQSPNLRLHPGNKRLRELVAADFENYNRAGNARAEKTRIAEAIVGQVEREGGRFLEKAKSKTGKVGSLGEKNDKWVVVTFKVAREKVSITFRSQKKQASRRA